MANYGKILTPISVLFIILGIVFGNLGAPVELFLPILAVGILLFIIGFSRLVQGKERKIMGQILRPKAAARGSAVWTLFFVNLMPIVLTYKTLAESIYSYLGAVPPFPVAILSLSTQELEQVGLTWLPFVYIGFTVVWLVGFILSGKIPKIVYVFNIFFILVSFSFWIDFGVQFLLWTFLANKTGIDFLEPWQSYTSIEQINELIVPLSIGAGVILLSTIMILKMLNNLQRGFANFSAKGIGKVVSFILMILTYLLSISPLTFGILNCLSTQSYIAGYVNYIPIVFIAIVLLRAITNIIKSVQDFSQKQTASSKGEKSPSAFGFSTAVFLVVLFIAWAPIILPLVDNGQNTNNNSIFNDQWNGWSKFRTELGEIYNPDNILSIQSSISTLGQLNPNKHIILMIPGPNKGYNPAAEIPYFLSAFEGNFSMFICSDQGSAGSLLSEMFFASLGVTQDFSQTTPLTFFPPGILRDNSSYYKNPAFPVIENWENFGGMATDVDKVVLGHATAFLGGDILASLGWEYLGFTSGEFSFVDVNNDEKFDETNDTYPIVPQIADLISSQEGSPLALAGELLKQGLPLGGYRQAVFSYKQIAEDATTRSGNGTYSSRVFCATDASWLNNDLLSLEAYDNLELAKNVLEWLRCGRSADDTYIVFDEAHIIPESGRTEVNSAASFGTTQGYVNWLSTNPILGLVYPIFALQTLRKWIPKEGNKKKLQLKDLEEAERKRAVLKFRTSSFFAQKINWYRAHHKYKQALLQLFRRIQRKVNRLLGDSGNRSVEAIMRAIQNEQGRYLSKNDYKRIQTFFEFMADLKRNKVNIKDEREFEDWFLEMSWIGAKI